MWITELRLTNVRGFTDSGMIKFSKTMNIFIGPNNSGKSTILNSILLLQKNTFTITDITLEKREGKIDVFFEDPEQYFPAVPSFYFTRPVINRQICLDLSRASGLNKYFAPYAGDNKLGAQDISSIEPNNLIYPYLSKRKVGDYSETINTETSNSITGNFHNLYSKIDRLSNPYFQPGFKEYEQACKEIIGFPVSTIASQNGKRAALIVKNLTHIPLTSMGEGVANLLGLIVDLCIAENKVFLIEEPENDIHPKALKALLGLIEKKSENNQFFISTHSNIVTKYLGSGSDSKLFKVNMHFKADSLLPISEIKEVGNNKMERQQALEELGYEFHDYDLWKAWMFLEESSAEVIIRDFLIPKFIPALGKKLRTYSAGSISEIETKFKDFNNLFVFLHLEPQYKNLAWVILDSGEVEKGIIDKMKEYYLKHGWNESNFSQFSEHDFEKYYPSQFQEEVERILQITDKQKKRSEKKQLLEEVKTWISENEDTAKEQFKESAKEVIEKLKLISKEINK